ncbi:MAG: bifunctional oligoribonuclease/PAP phosphatase NrnA [Candidatus Omnitrophica bacterium]|nr:bifunctional oligoribonuclease/PAP phosphatase NrnA [Candidatus Omnitrophota bacterium]
MPIDDIIKVIEKHKSFLVTAHINPEGDAIGSQLAIASLLRQLGKEVRIIDNDSVPETLKWLPGAKEIELSKDIKECKFDAALVLDSPNIERIGDVARLTKGSDIVNIDHHVSNEKFAKIRWVDPHMSSCGEMVFHIYKAMKEAIPIDSAMNMYIAIATDTGSFRYSNTSGDTHNVAAELIKMGIKPEEISEKIYEQKDFASVKLIGECVSTVQVTPDKRIAYLEARRDMFKRTGSRPEDTENFINFARMIKGVDVAIFFREADDGKTHVSFRSKGNFDVNTLATAFDGGGHRKASGCTLDLDLEKAKKKVLKKTKEMLSE